MPRILVAGCGYVGAATADLFHRAGWEVEGWTSSEASAQQLKARPYPVRAVDLTDAAAVAKAARNRFDAVVHAASSRGGGVAGYREIYLGGARNLLEALPQALLLFTSSTSVYAQRAGEWVTEASPAEPERETGRVLRETEELVLSRDGIVGRLAGIYGPGRSALLWKFLAGEAVIDSAPRFINQAHRDDIASALFLLVSQALTGSAATAERRIYNVADGHPITDRECYEWLSARFDRPLPPIASAPLERKRGNSSKRVSSKKLQAVGWTPRYPTFEIAMTESIVPSLKSHGV